MPPVTIKHYRDLAAYAGPHAIDKIRFRSARAPLDVSAWGMNVIEMDAGCESYPEHDHLGDQQEEVYLVLEGSVDLVFDGERKALSQGTFARVSHAVKRKLVTTDQSAVILALGGTPGKAYTSSGL